MRGRRRSIRTTSGACSRTVAATWLPSAALPTSCRPASPRVPREPGHRRPRPVNGPVQLVATKPAAFRRGSCRPRWPRPSRKSPVGVRSAGTKSSPRGDTEHDRRPGPGARPVATIDGTPGGCLAVPSDIQAITGRAFVRTCCRPATLQPASDLAGQESFSRPSALLPARDLARRRPCRRQNVLPANRPRREPRQRPCYRPGTPSISTSAVRA
jgi:hypothetical protein